MKRILFFIESLAGGGAEKVLTDLVSNLNREHYDITVCTVTDEGVYQKQVEAVCHYRSFLRMADYRAGGIRKAMFWLKTKLIYCLPAKLVYHWGIKEHYDYEVAFVEGFATKLIAESPNEASKKVAWVHTNVVRNPHADRHFASLEDQIRAYRRFDRVVCVSKSVLEACQDKFRFQEKLCTQYNPVDEKKVIAAGRESVDLKPSFSPLLGAVGRLEVQKGFDRLIACAKKIRDDGGSFEIWIIGDGTQRQELQRQIQEAGLSNMVKLMGFQTNPHKYMACCDAFICSSYDEGFSTAATESLLLGKPVFTVECAGMNELIGGEICGEIVENSDEALLQMLERIVSIPNYIDDHSTGVCKRASEMKLAARIREIDQLLKVM